MIEKLVDLMTTGKFRLAVEKVIVRLKIFYGHILHARI